VSILEKEIGQSKLGKKYSLGLTKGVFTFMIVVLVCAAITKYLRLDTL
jgi:hypothetical protein